MTSVYIKLVIANAQGMGGRTIASVPAKHMVAVAAGVILKGIEDGETYITIGDVPDKYKNDVIAALDAEGYGADGTILE